MLTDRPIRFLQVARILSPIINCLDNLETLVDTDQGIRALIDEGFGGFATLKLDILHDFFGLRSMEAALITTMTLVLGIPSPPPPTTTLRS